MKFNYAVLRNQQFLLAMRKLTNYPFKAQKVAYSVMKISNAIDAEMKLSQDLFIKLLKQHAVLDDKGAFVPQKDPEGKDVPDTFQTTPGKEAELEKAQGDFADVEFEVKWRPLKLDELEECRISAVELGMLGDIIAAPLEEAPAPEPAK